MSPMSPSQKNVNHIIIIPAFKHRSINDLVIVHESPISRKIINFQHKQTNLYHLFPPSLIHAMYIYVCVYAYISEKSKRVSKNPNIIYVIKKQNQKTYLDFEAGLWNIGALRTDLVVRISRSSRVSPHFQKRFQKTQKVKEIPLLFKTQKTKNTQKLEPLEKWTKTQKKELAQRMFQRDPRSRAAGQVQAPIISRSITQKLYLYIYNKLKKYIYIYIFGWERTIIICWFGYSVFVIVLLFIT